MAYWLYETVHHSNGDIALRRIEEDEEPLFVIKASSIAKHKLAGQMEEIVQAMFQSAMAVIGDQDLELYPNQPDTLADYAMSMEILPSIH